MAIKPLAHSTSNKTNEITNSDEQDQSGMLQRVLANLKIAALPIPDKLRKRLIEVV